jgi:hypothetical protein
MTTEFEFADLDDQVLDWEHARRSALADGAPVHVAEIIADHCAGVFGFYSQEEWNDYNDFLARAREAS